MYASKETTACLAESGRVFTWGQGDEFQLGHDSTNNESIPREVEALARIRVIDLSLGDSHMPPLNQINQTHILTRGPKKEDVRLPGTGNSNSHGARPVDLIVTSVAQGRST